MIYASILTLAASVLGLLQNYLSSRHDKFGQIQRNFNETYFIVIICFLITMLLDGNGAQGIKAAGLYLTGRLLYVFITLINWHQYRKIAWAVSMIGVVGWVLISIQSIIQQFV